MCAKKDNFQDEYWCLDPNGAPDWRGNPPRKKIEAADLPQGADIVIMDMVEDMDDPVEVDEHWKQFHGHIANGKYVKLVKGGAAGIAKAKRKHAKKSGGSGWVSANQPLTLVLLEQFLDPSFWDWTDVEKQTLGNLPAMMGVIRERLEAAGLEPKVLYGIFHDKDEHDVWDPQLEAYKREPKNLHVHVVGKLGKGATLAKQADIIGVPVQQLEKPDSGRWTFDNKSAYLIHAKEFNKYIYDPQEVHTELGEDYMQLYARQKQSWEKGRAKKIHNAARDDVEWLVDMILTGKVTRNNVNLTDEYFRIYSRNKHRCDEAFEAYAERRMAQEVLALENGEYSCSTIYIKGEAGSGKSLFAYSLVRWLCRVYGWRYARATADHATEKWKGEEILFLDDVRVSALNVTGWLQLLDPFQANPIDERYRGKNACKPRVMIITSTLEPVEYFYYVRNQSAASRNEALDQFFRRLLGVVTVMKYDMDSPYNCTWEKPERVALYSRTVKRFDENHACRDEQVNGLTIDFLPNQSSLIMGEKPFYTYWGMAEVLAREIDARNSDILISRQDAQTIFSSVHSAIAKRFAGSPMPFPDNYENLPLAIPQSQTKTMLARAAEQAAQIAQASQREAERILAQQQEQERLNEVITEGEFAGKTVQQAEWIQRERQQEARRQAKAEKEKAEEAERHAQQLDRARQACVGFIASHTEEFLHSHFDSLLESEFWLAAAAREHLDSCYCAKDLSDAELAAVFSETYRLRFPA